MSAEAANGNLAVNTEYLKGKAAKVKFHKGKLEAVSQEEILKAIHNSDVGI